MEDLLTSNVFQLLRYISLENGLLPVLREAVNIDGDKLNIQRDKYEAELCFWKNFSNSEPDIFIELKNKENVIYSIMVEAKYLSGKSGTAIFEGEEDAQIYIAGSDQLEREWNDLKGYSAKKNTRCFLVYLTMHWTIPTIDLKSSIEVIGDDSRKNIYWLNWQSIHSILEDILKETKGNLSDTEKIVIKDIVELLNKKGLKEFSGYSLPVKKDLKTFHFFKPQFYSNLSVRNFEPVKFFSRG